MIKKCPTCLTSRNHQHSEPIINHPIRNQAWKKIVADPFRLQYYLLMIGYYSKFIVIEMLENLLSSTVINKCKKIFSKFGTPKELATDNGTEFTSNYFKSFLITWDFECRVLVRIFTNQMDQQNVVYKLLSIQNQQTNIIIYQYCFEFPT